MHGYSPQVFDKEFWLKRAEESRSLNEQMTDPDVRRQIRTIAEGYERIAQYAKEQTQLKEKYGISD
jgi:hypothetical protein